jgi:WD40 repeat protein
MKQFVKGIHSFFEKNMLKRILIGIACIFALMSLAFQIWVLVKLISLDKEIGIISQQILSINQLEANRTSSTPISTTLNQYPSTTAIQVTSKTSPNIPSTSISTTLNQFTSISITTATRVVSSTPPPLITTTTQITSTTSPNIPTTQTTQTPSLTDFDPQNSFLGNLNGHGDEVNLMVPLSDGLLATGSYDDKIIIWNTTSRTQKYNFGLQNGGHEDAVSCLISLDNNKRLASGSFDFNIKIWDILNGRLLFNFNSSNGGHNG